MQAFPVWSIGDLILDLYEVTGFLGQGGMGRVYRVRHRGWGTDLALKVPLPEMLAGPNGVAGFEREAETWVNLGLHPHAVSCYYVRRIDSLPCVFAECVEGGSLHDWIAGTDQDGARLYQGSGREVLARMIDLAIQTAWGLAFAHGQDLIHLDVKPANVMITRDGAAKVTDFGLAQGLTRAQAEDEGRNRESAGQAPVIGPGTFQYFSPEQAGGRELGIHADMWGWGLCVLEMFMGGRTWEAGAVADEVLRQYAADGPGHPGLPTMPAALVGLLGRVFQPDPADRPEDMMEAASVLVRIYQEIIDRPYARTVPAAGRDTADSLNNRAVSLVDLGRREEAESLWVQAVARQPHHPEATYNHGLTLWRSGRLDDAALVSRLAEVGRSHPDRVLPRYLGAMVHLERDDCREALATLSRLSAEGAARPEIRLLHDKARERLRASNRQLRLLAGHRGQVQTVAFSPDLSLALSGGEDRHIRLWDVRTGKPGSVLRDHRGEVNSACFGPDGRHVLSGGGDFVSSDFALRLWDAAGGRPLTQLIGHTGAVTSVAMSPDGRLGLSGSTDGEVRLWDLETGQSRRVLRGHKGAVLAVAFGPDGRTVYSAGADRTIRLWEVDSGRATGLLGGHKGPVGTICPARGRPILISGGADRTVRVWDLVSGQAVKTLAGHLGEVNAVSVSSDGGFAISAGADRTLRLWDIEAGRCVRTFEGHTASVASAVLSRNGRYALSGGVDKSVRLWKTDGSAEVFRAPMVLTRTLSSEKTLDAQADYTRYVEEARGKLEADDARAAAESIRKARRQPGYARGAEALAVWRRLYLKLPRAGFRGGWEEAVWSGHSQGVRAVCLNEPADLAVTASADGGLHLWDVEEGTARFHWEGHEADVYDICLDPEGRWALSGGADRTVRLWSVGDGACLGVWERHQGPVFSVAVSPDARTALSGGERGTILVWSLPSGELKGALVGHQTAVNSIRFDPSGQRALSAGGDYTGEENVLRLWDVESRTCIRILEGHERSVNSACFGPDGRLALSGGSDGLLKVWDLETGECVQSMAGHQGGVLGVSCSGDGRFGLSAGFDHTVRLWDLEQGRRLRTFEGHTAPVSSVAFSRDGRLALSAGRDRTVRVWFLDWDLAEPPASDWDEGADPILLAFLKGRTVRDGKPDWTGMELDSLMYRLACAGRGWMAADRVGRRLVELSRPGKAAETQTGAGPRKDRPRSWRFPWRKK
ncbi:MAG: protein kinase [Proteobacteria bacterium]|nr:protein kinase [Pseudomonadota bacterium]